MEKLHDNIKDNVNRKFYKNLCFKKCFIMYVLSYIMDPL